METSQIIKDCIGNEITTEEILKRIKIIAIKLNDMREIEWIDNELNGYNKNIPNYRKIQGIPYADIHQGTHILKRAHIPVPKPSKGDNDEFDPSVIDYATSIPIMEKSLNEGDTKEFGRAIDLGVAQTWGELVGVTGHIMQLRITLHKTQIDNIVKHVRNIGLDLLIDMEKKYGTLNKYDPNYKKEKEIKEQNKKNSNEKYKIVITILYYFVLMLLGYILLDKLIEWNEQNKIIKTLIITIGITLILIIPQIFIKSKKIKYVLITIFSIIGLFFTIYSICENPKKTIKVKEKFDKMEFNQIQKSKSK